MSSYFHESSVPLAAPEVDGFRGHYPGANVAYGLTGYGSQPLVQQALPSQPYTAYQPAPFQAPRETYMPPPPKATPTPPAARSPDTFDREQPLFERLVPVSVQEAGMEEKTKLLMIRVLASNGSYTADGGLKSVNDTSRRTTAAQKSPFHLPASTNCVRVEVTDDRNHFCLHTLEVGERAFHELKLQQRMVIDFTAFAGKLIEMLDYCCGGGEGSNNDANNGGEHGGERKAPPSRSSPSSIQFGPGFMEGSGGGQGHAHSCRQREASMGGHPAPRFTSVLRVKPGEMSQFCIIEVNSFNHVTHLSLSLKVHTYI
jgi:hypothetical protein